MVDFSFLLIKGIEIPDAVKDTFDRVARDPYIKGDYKFRCRAISRSKIENGELSWTETTPFLQGEDINSYLGGVARTYPECEDVVKRYMESLFTAGPVANLFRGQLDIAECHQIRITASDMQTGNPTPEGWHRDGYDYVGVLCVGRRNVSGATSYVRKSELPNKIVFEGLLEPGDLILMDDEAMQHYTSAITPALPGEAARDIFVLTINVLPAARQERETEQEMVFA